LAAPIRHPGKGFWVPYMRIVNLFSFWIEHHPLKKLKFPLSAFKENHQEWIQALNEWEETATQEFRVIAAKPETSSKVLPVSVASSVASKPVKPADDPRVSELIRYTYAETGVAPDNKKVAILIATHGYEYVQGALRDNLKDLEESEHSRFIRTFFSESGGLAIIADYRDAVLSRAAAFLVAMIGSAEDEDKAKKFCLPFSAASLISLSDDYLKLIEKQQTRKVTGEKTSTNKTPIVPTEKEESQRRTKWLGDLDAWTQDAARPGRTMAEFLVNNPQPKSLSDGSLIMVAQERRNRLLAGETI